MAKGPSESAVRELEFQERAGEHRDLAQAELYEAERRVLKIQTKLHQWATEDPDRRFADLLNLVADPAVLRVAWDRVRSNRGARSAGVDAVRPRDLRLWEQEFLAGLRAQLKAGTFAPLPVRQRMIPKTGGKVRRLGIPTVAA